MLRLWKNLDRFTPLYKWTYPHIESNTLMQSKTKSNIYPVDKIQSKTKFDTYPTEFKF